MACYLRNERVGFTLNECRMVGLLVLLMVRLKTDVEVGR